MSSGQTDIPIDNICCVGCPGTVFRLESGKSDIFRISEKIPVCLFQMQLGIGQCQRVRFLQPGEFLLVFCRRDPETLSCFFVILLLVGKHPIIDKTYTAKASGKILFLFFIWVKPVLSYDIFLNGSLFFCHPLPPASQCTFLSHRSLRLRSSKDNSSGSRRLPSRVSL